MNWGWKIAIAYTAFAGMVLAFVFAASINKVNLVEEDYYKKEIEYQNQIERIINTNELGSKFIMYLDVLKKAIVVENNGDKLISGELQFYRPSDSSIDIVTAFKVNSEDTLEIQTNTLERGLWIIKANWTLEDKSYYKSIQIELE